MPHESFDTLPEDQNVVLVDEATVRKAEKLILGCKTCSPEDAEVQDVLMSLSGFTVFASRSSIQDTVVDWSP